MSTEMIKLESVGNPYKGQDWNYKGQSQVCQIFISYEDSKINGFQSTINGLQFQYLSAGSLMLSKPLGRMRGSSFKAIKLDYPSEYITWVKIKSWNENGVTVWWMAFKTNLGKRYGPFPPTSPKPGDDMFSSGFDLGKDNQFGGFYGTTDGNSINSLGIYVQPISSMKSNSEVP